MITVSNRLPIVVSQTEQGPKIRAAAGGLVTALTPVLRKHQGMWIGWPGCPEDPTLQKQMDEFTGKHGYSLQGVDLTEAQVDQFYYGFSNETLWPLFHDLLGHCHFSAEHWKCYQEVNELFAEQIIKSAPADKMVWVHDYQLLLVGAALKSRGFKAPIKFFLHIPFPSPDLFRRLPWRRQIIEAMMEYDLIGLQTLHDRKNFVACVREFYMEVEAETRRRYTLLLWRGRKVKVGHYPISIDFDEFDQQARSEEVAEKAWFLHENLEDRQLVLGIDRLDYTKGVPERFLAFERLLEKYPELRSKVSLLQVVVPSRTLVPEYQQLKNQLDQLAGRINSSFGEPGWVPIHYVFRSLNRVELLAHYRACEIGLITPLRDGMNLVAKEYCAASIDNNGVLVLSEFAGAADQMKKHALLVNPYDVEGMADTLYEAVKMPLIERTRRMKMLRSGIRRNDVYQWVEWILGDRG
ncbi:MAG: trehalose-6-phosphate synthase [Desulfuromonas sp.]|nr:MAG: trehalose-6-phosphate synthase [Desulfuromonas sp.]